MKDGPKKGNDRAPMPVSRVETQGKVGAGFIVQCLGQALLEGQPADRCLRNVFAANHQLGSRDRRIITETLFSVLRWWGWLKHLAPAKFVSCWQSVGSFRKSPEEKPQIQIRSYEWYGCLAASWYLDNRVDLPQSVAWWCRQSGVNPDRIQPLPAGAPLKDRRKYLKHFFGDQKMPALTMEALVPEWTVQYFAEDEQVDFLQLIDWLQRRPPVWLRMQTKDVDQLVKALENEDFRPKRHETMSCALRLQGQTGNLKNMPAFRNGQFEIQDLASQAVGYVCAPEPGQQWWDCCAGGGGKTLQLASLMQGKGSVLASDIRVHKLEELKLRARRAQFPNIRYQEWRGVEVPRFRNRFDGILVDTACSCSGTWRRNPYGRWTTAEDDLNEFSALQLQLLTNASKALADGGVLVYSTCSMFACENQEVVRKFLEQNPEFKLEPFVCPLTGRETSGMNQIWPWDGDCDAMFTARFRKAVSKPEKD